MLATALAALLPALSPLPQASTEQAALPQAEELATLEMEPVEVRGPDGGTRTAYRGMLRVPIVRADPGSKEIGVDVWRFPADEGVPEDRTPVFRLNGGPGWPGMTPSQVDWSDFAPLTAWGDLVIVGQRGIGTSEPNTSCDQFAQPLDPALPEEELVEAIQAQCRACKQHWEAEGYDLSGFNVIEAAGDVNDVRRLLGYDEIALLGGSFGSHWGMTVMRYHPDIVARAVLHGMEGPDHTYDSPSGVLAALERMAAAAEASPQLADHVPPDGLIEALRTVITAFEQEPLEWEVDGKPVLIDGSALRELSMGYTTSVRSRAGIAGWPLDVIRLYQADFEDAARAVLRSQEPDNGLPTASFFNLDCGSGITAARLERYTNDPAIEIIGDLSRFYRASCPAWEVDLGDDFRADFTTTIPTVIIHGTWDVSTPFDNALELIPCFEDLHFLPVDGGTHGALGEAFRHDPAFAEAVQRFLFTGATENLPENGVQLPPIDWQAPR